MATALTALLPIFLLILLGHLFRRWQFVPDAFWAPAERLTYYVTFPALLVANLAEAEVAGLPVVSLAATLAGATLLSAGALVMLRPRLGRLDGAAFSSLLQGVIRPNTYVGLAAAAALYGAPGVTLTAIAIATVVPLVNLISVTGMVHYAAGHQRATLRRLVLPIVTNPLILACASGIAINAADLPLPLGLLPTLKILGAAALPIGLLAVGAGLSLRALRGSGGAVLLSAGFKLVLLPLVTAAVTLMLGLPGVAVGVAVLYAALPCSASAYVLARQMGGDAPLMASIITTQTLLAGITIPLFLLLLESP